MFWLWMIIVMTLAALLELVAGCNGFALPVLALAGFYFSVLGPWRGLLVPYLAIGVALDLSFARALPVHVIIMPAVLLGGRLWCLSGEVKSVPIQALPGVMVGVVAGLAGVGGQLLAGHCDLSQGRYFAWFLLENMAWGLLLLPLSCLALDGVARSLALRRYSRITPHELSFAAEGRDAFNDEQ